MTTVASFLPALPADLVHLVLDYAPGVALDVLPVHERIEVVRRLTGLTLSEERASLVLEQRDVNNRDFDDLQLAADDEAWFEALRSAFSPRSFDELTRHGHMRMPLEFKSFLMRSLAQGGHQALALVQHLEQLSPESDILCLTLILEEFLNTTMDVPTAEYVLRRLLHADNLSLFAVCWQQQQISIPDVARVFLTDAPTPLELLACRFHWNLRMSGWRDRWWESMPLLQALVSVRPETPALLLHFGILQLMTNNGVLYISMDARDRIDAISAMSNARPPGTFVFGWNAQADNLMVTYGSITNFVHTVRHQNACVCEWWVEDWLAQARQASDWSGFLDVFPSVNGYPFVTRKLIDSVPDEVIVRSFTQHPEHLRTFYYWSSVPARLMTLISFDLWMAGFSGLTSAKSDPPAFLFFTARQRVLLRRESHV
jgi:hypothetical protein